MKELGLSLEESMEGIAMYVIYFGYKAKLMVARRHTSVDQESLQVPISRIFVSIVIRALTRLIEDQNVIFRCLLKEQTFRLEICIFPKAMCASFLSILTCRYNLRRFIFLGRGDVQISIFIILLTAINFF